MSIFNSPSEIRAYYVFSLAALKCDDAWMAELLGYHLFHVKLNSDMRQPLLATETVYVWQ
jgi:hypothetical protein